MTILQIVDLQWPLYYWNYFQLPTSLVDIVTTLQTA